MSSSLNSAPYSIIYSCASEYNADGTDNYCSDDACYTVDYCNTDNCNQPTQTPVSSVSKCYVGSNSNFISTSCTTTCVMTTYSTTTNTNPYMQVYSCSVNETSDNVISSCDLNNFCATTIYCNFDNCNSGSMLVVNSASTKRLSFWIFFTEIIYVYFISFDKI